MQAIAIVLLLAAVVGLMTSELMGAQGIWAWGIAFCEAAAVGAIADWFAVVALFRRPLGLPIPHTAVIPQSKARIAESLAVFVRDHFLDAKALLEKVAAFDPAGRLAQWLVEPERMQGWFEAARQWGLHALDWLDDKRLQQAFKDLAMDALQRWDAAQTAGQLLAALTLDGRHQELLDATLDKIADYLGQDDVRKRVSERLVKHARMEWPAVIGVVNSIKPIDAIADSLADKLAQALMTELREVLQQPDHPVRLTYAEKVEDFITRLRNDPELVAHIQEIKAHLIERPEVQDFAENLAQEAKAWLRQDLSRPDSKLGQYLQAAMADIGSRLATDASLRQAINTHLLSTAAKLADDLRDGMTEHIATTVKNWDDREFVHAMELSVGKDLQFIRFNGTLVGGIVGLLIHAFLHFGLPMLR
jgi:uncharacterized membrane-anchored protein YjiN (DUF445 family)